MENVEQKKTLFHYFFFYLSSFFVIIDRMFFYYYITFYIFLMSSWFVVFFLGGKNRVYTVLGGRKSADRRHISPQRRVVGEEGRTTRRIASVAGGFDRQCAGTPEDEGRGIWDRFRGGSRLLCSLKMGPDSFFFGGHPPVSLLT